MSDIKLIEDQILVWKRTWRMYDEDKSSFIRFKPGERVMCPGYYDPGPWIIIREYTYDKLNQPSCGYPTYDTYREGSPGNTRSHWGPNMKRIEDPFITLIKRAAEETIKEYTPLDLTYRDSHGYTNKSGSVWYR